MTLKQIVLFMFFAVFVLMQTGCWHATRALANSINEGEMVVTEIPEHKRSPPKFVELYNNAGYKARVATYVAKLHLNSEPAYVEISSEYFRSRLTDHSLKKIKIIDDRPVWIIRPKDILYKFNLSRYKSIDAVSLKDNEIIFIETITGEKCSIIIEPNLAEEIGYNRITYKSNFTFKAFLFPFTVAFDVVTGPIQFIVPINDYWLGLDWSGLSNNG